MEMYQFVILCLLALIGIIAVIAAIIIIPKKNNSNSEEINQLRDEIEKSTQMTMKNTNDEIAALRTEVITSTQNSVKNMGEMIATNQQSFSAAQSEKLLHFEDRLKTFSLENEQKLENIRRSMEQKLSDIRDDNNKQLTEMRTTVDEKLQKTLEEKMNRSFALVSERLEQVYKGLGEMQTLAVGVGDLKKVLSNVKTRGIVGEIQLGNILEEILTPDQYDTNVATKKGSREVVEFAIKLPARDDGFIYLPIDSKFPGDSYAALRDAYDSGSKEAVDAAAKNLINTIRREAKDIRDKYIDPPNTTEFAVMFLPFEGLYSEVVNRGMVELLQRDYKVNIAGPSTMAALLNSIQMGFKTLAVQKRSAEVWNLLGSVKKEFETFNTVLVATQTKLDQANKELDKLVGVRTRQITRKLSAVESNDTPIEAYFSNLENNSDDV
ncbi:DNA recombination protein RmuC [uncultured Ruminococcus sp.]|uniref:DNA recombination protein RmuC n=1 Tax=uncultured Ruminococcus sp. TaxID=165186 RepID=UPI00293116CF|nr:DNA recombination protein RmuC [uncultured Ruminococcus sp.]